MVFNFFRKLEYETNKKVYLEAIGAGGYGNLQQYLLAKNLKHKIDPDFILFQFCNNDFMDNTLEWKFYHLIESIYEEALH